MSEHELGDVLDEAKQTVTGDRQDTYGSPEDSFGLIADYWNAYLSRRLSMIVQIDPIDTVNLLILMKQARKIGQKPHRDNYRDAAGYEAIAADRFLQG